MFKWIKSNGCNCCPIEEGCEKYLLNVGDLWGGYVELKKNKESGELVWEGWYTVCGRKLSGQSGGGETRDYYMTWVEGQITDAIKAVFSAHEEPVRRIFDSLIETNENGEWVQREIS